MSEQKIPIPAMLYNSAVGGHVTNSQQIIDEDYNLEQKDVNKEVLGVPYNSTTPNGMGRIVLKKNDNFKQVIEAQTNGNTIFVIKYDFTLTDNITVPTNCVLEFEGGSISGAYTITGIDTDIVANSVKIIDTSITLAGTWKCVFNLCWFGLSQSNIDNGTIINNIHIPSGITAIIPEGNYNFATPVLMPSFKSFTFYGNLRYTGTQTNTSFIKMSGFGVYNFLGAVSCESQSINYTNANNSNIIGIEIYNAKCCKFTIADIHGFNENVRVSSYGNIGDGGCAWNTFNILENRKANKHIRIYQEDVDSSHFGWVNENRFYLGRQAVDANVYAAGSVYLLYADLSETSNMSDDNIFYGTYEVAQFSNVIPIYLNNVQYFRFRDIRHEGANKLAKIVGDCYNLVFDVTYGKSEINANWYDLSECNTQPFDPDFMVKNFVGEISLIDKEVIDGNITSEWYGYKNVRTNPSNVVKASINANNDVVFDANVYGGQEIPCMFVESDAHKIFYLENMTSGQYSDIFISYARNSNGELISKDGNDAYADDKVKVGEKYLVASYSPSSSAGTHLISDNQTYRIQRRVSFRIPDDITGFYISISKGFNRFRLYSLATNPYTQFEPKVLKRLT